jgi:heme-degrading monooxygenase HmoA
MYEVTVTFKRQNTDEDFFAFSTYDKEMLYAHTRFRNEVMNAPGFMALSFVLSDDKLEMAVITLWESLIHSQEFFVTGKHAKAFDFQLKRYLGRTGTIKTVTTASLPDTAQLKAKKISSRLSVEVANQTLKELLTKQTEERHRGEHALFLTDDPIDAGGDDAEYR